LEHPSGCSCLVRELVDSVRDFLGAVPGAVKNHLNTEELARITLTAVVAGGGIFGILEAVMMAAGSIFPAPTDAALAATILAVVLEVFRRLQHGDDPTAFRPPVRSKSSK
jgi:cobalamin synthase